MPAKKSAPKKVAEARPAPEAESAAATEPAEPAEAASAGEVTLNRAERRARGKGKAVVQPTTRGKVVGQHGPAHTHRMWSNRRSG